MRPADITSVTPMPDGSEEVTRTWICYEVRVVQEGERIILLEPSGSWLAHGTSAEVDELVEALNAAADHADQAGLV